MNDTKRRNLQQDWEEHWKRAGQGKGLTWLGKRMTRSKQKAVRRLIPPLGVDTVLDVGSGFGHLYAVFKSLDLDVLGIDASPTAASHCRDRGLNVQPTRLEDMDRTFDLVASDGLLEHELDFVTTARHMMRISRRFVLLIQPNHDSFRGKTMAFLAEVLRGKSNIREYNYRLADFIEVFVNAGYPLVRSIPVFGDVFRILLFEKESGRIGDANDPA